MALELIKISDFPDSGPLSDTDLLVIGLPDGTGAKIDIASARAFLGISVVEGIAEQSTDPVGPTVGETYFAGVGTFTNFLDVNGDPITTTENLNVLTYNGTFWDVLPVPITVDLSGYATTGALDLIDNEKPNVVSATHNIADKDAFQEGYAISSVNGEPIVAANFMITGVIRVTPGQTYTRSCDNTYAVDTANIHIYDINMAWLGITPAAATFTVPSNGYYFRQNIAVSTGTWDLARDSYQLQTGSVATPYQEFYPIAEYQGTDVVAKRILNGEILGDVSKPNSPARQMDLPTLEMEKPGNKFDPSTMILADAFVSVAEGHGIADAVGWKTMYNMPIQPGLTYTISGWNSAQQAMAIIKGTNPRPPADSPDYILSGRASDIGFVKLDGKCTFLAPPESTFLACTIRSATESDSLFDEFMVEAGKEASPYEPYDPNTPEEIYGISGHPLRSATAEATTPETDLRAFVSATQFYVRIPFNNSYDLLHIWDRSNNNGVANTNSVYRIDKSLPDGESLLANTDGLIHDVNDNISPMMLDTIITTTGNHGIASVKVTAAAHGKDAQDLFSVWQSSALEWILVEVIDVNTLRFFGKSYAGTNGDVIPRSMGSNTITHVSGATHTGTITATQRLTEEIFPSVKSVTQELLVDGKPASAGINYGNIFSLKEIQEIGDFRQPVLSAPFEPSSGPTMITRSIVYSYDKTNSLYVDEVINFVIDWYLLRIGFLQAQKFTPGTDATVKNMAYMPNSNNAVANGNNINFRAPFDLSSPLGGANDVYFGSSVPANNPNVTVVEDVDKPVQRMVQLLETAGGERKYGYAHGYFYETGSTKASLRKSYAEQWDLRNNTAKSYPRGLYELAPNEGVYHGMAYHQYFDPSINENAVVYWHKEGQSWIVYIDYHADVVKDTVSLPQYLSGLSITEVDKIGITINSGDIVPLSGINLTSVTANGYAYAVLKLT
ncbi:MAG TPA: hypothetical protein VD907_06685 [Verrucomicrobiae bacterium]|nr:hypothetical protein [Verrucomicrobiae bacterium]